jgi:hypothetical protein
MSHPYPMVPGSDDGLPNLAGDQSQMSRSANGGNQAGAAARGGNFDQAYGANPQMQSYGMATGQNGMPMYGSGASNQQVDWAQNLSFQQHSGAQQHTYGSAFSPNTGQTQIADKDDNNAEPGTDVSAAAGPYFFALETPQSSVATLASRITNFVQTATSRSMYPPDFDIASFFSPDNVREFLINYKHFHIHFPMLHLPTFCATDAYEGLLASLCCVGACYAKDRVSGDEVRRVAEVLWGCLSDQSPLCHAITSQTQLQRDPYSWKADELEQIEAFVAVHMLLIWNGTAEQRESARARMSLLARFIRSSGMLEFNPQTPQSSDFNWESWVHDEKVVRLIHIVYLADTAMFLYFNMAPQLDPFDIQVPLPCDDGAWDAQTPIECGAALNLYGQEECQLRNPDGTQVPRQPQTNMVLTALLAESPDRQPGPTNLWSKFILVHSIIALLLRVEQGGYTLGGSEGYDESDASSKAVIANALKKFKATWDADMAQQFPPSASSNPRRHGFSRDGIYFYWLAMAMLKQSQKPHLQAPADQRFQRVMHWIKSLKQWVQADGAKRGEELGSVGAIDKDYGSVDTTLDMTMLFQPLPDLLDDPSIPSVKTEGN